MPARNAVSTAGWRSIAGSDIRNLNDMPITQSAKQALRKDHRRTIVNLRRKRVAKKTVDIMKKNPNEANFKQASSHLDKLVKNRLIHKNKAARLKSTLSRLIKPAPSSSSRAHTKSAKKTKK